MPGGPVDPICLIVAGIVRATLPDAEFTLAWEHSVQKTRWEERYVAMGPTLVLTQARVKGSGAGMEPAPSAVLRDGWWVWQPQTTLEELRLARSTYTRDYTLCSMHRCAELDALVGPIADDSVLVIRPCPDDTADRSGGAR